MQATGEDDANARRWLRIRALFDEAMQLPAAERVEHVRRAVGTDADLARDVLEMLTLAAVPATPAEFAAARQQVRDLGVGSLGSHAAANLDQSPAADLLRQLLSAPRLDHERYARGEEIGRGGMGIVHRIHDRVLHRDLAIKSLRAAAPPTSEAAALARQELLSRFLAEAQLTSQLDHPGVVPVHELGLDQDGRIFFTMRLIAGQTASAVFALCKAGDGDWPLTRALEVVLKVCDTLAFAHQKGVIHRDVKPGNVMVGRFGEVYVVDWGLAKLLPSAPNHAQPAPATLTPTMITVRGPDGDADGPDVLRSRSGQRIGTPSYMAPEHLLDAAADVQSDVYGIGAMLYELLGGMPPYADALAGSEDPGRVWRLLAEQPPTALERLRPDLPPELIAITEKAMARDRSCRYPSATSVASELRAYLAGRVVTAHRSGPWVELRLWLRRNRALAAACVGLVVVLLVGIALTSLATWRARDEASAAQRARKEAEHHRQQADERLRAFEQLSAVVRFDHVLASAERLHPAFPEQVAALRSWLDDEAGSLSRMRGDLNRSAAALPTLQSLSASPAQPFTEASGFLVEETQKLLAKLDLLEREVRPGVERRLRFALQVHEATLRHPGRGAEWQAVREALAEPLGIPPEQTFRDEDVMGLVPIGRNPRTGLIELYDLASAWDGTMDLLRIPIPRHAADGNIPVDDSTGIVFVLLPGGRFVMGAQRDDPAAPNYDPDARSSETPHSVALEPFLIARHELTQAQWQALAATSNLPPQPSQFLAGVSDRLGGRIRRTHPVEQISWTMAAELLRHHAMTLPTEAQWEFAARGGTSTPFFCARNELPAHANVADATAKAASVSWVCEAWRDGHVLHAPVDSLNPNPFGLFHVHGNVWEWCADEYGDYAGPVAPGTGLRLRGDGSNTCVHRGGSYAAPATESRSAFRGGNTKAYLQSRLGVRPARSLRRQ